ncbi:MAG: phosphatidate cytidylyltransferase [Defluviitaleaceae bacterium]|nr:phosphatidate cytidylyltransferase [Defluviitaleaceae bacterium]MCL2835599.1 phosphatidate cytidylyltransferase [Defluviitaleaceae bacterium]
MVQRLNKNSTFKRVLTSIAGVPVLIVCLVAGGWVLKSGLLLVSLIGMHEFYKALSDKSKPMHWAGYACAAVYYVFIGNTGNANVVTIILISFTLLVCAITVFFHKTVSIRDTAVTYFGFCYVAVLLSTIFLINETHGGWLVSVAFVSAWGCDTGAFIFGKALGKHKLTPALSPKKTVEGAIGGTLTAALLTAPIIGMAVFNGGMRYALIGAVIGAVCAIFAQLGDLFASAIKRHTGIKDFGAVLPGHGGVIDRFDSVLFTAPILYILSLIILK